MVSTINPDATVIPDKAEVWLALKSGVTSLAAITPVDATQDFEALGWSFSGLIDDKKGIPLDPAIEVKPYDAFGYPQFRVKLRKGTLKSGFTVLETNAVTKTIVLPGSASSKIGIPKDIQVYVLYRFVDDSTTRAWMSLRPAPIELKSHGGIVDGELSYAEMAVHHTADANNDVFLVIDDTTQKTFTIGSGVTAYTVTVGGQTTTSITSITAAGLQTALRALSTVGANGVTVTGTGTGPFTAVFTASTVVATAAGTGGTVTIS
jgi:hypothetical protein